MPGGPLPLAPQTVLRRLLAEQAIAFAKELEATAHDAPPGPLLARCEDVAVARRRLFLAWRGRPAASREAFQKAQGDIELQIGAAKVNTDTGWGPVAALPLALAPAPPLASPAGLSCGGT